MAESMSEEADALLGTQEDRAESQLSAARKIQRSSNPPSSGTLSGDELPENEAASPSRNHSNEQMNVELEDIPDSSMTIVNELYSTAPQDQTGGKDSDSSASKMTSSHAHSMLPPPAPVSNKTHASQEPPQSGQGFKGAQKAQSQKATESGHGTRDDVMTDDIETSELVAIGDPKEEVERFDWENLQSRYHDRMNELNNEEHSIMVEFESLCNFFGVWAQCGSNREVERSLKRLHTQMTLVQHHEDELEKKRQHYIKVVEAFKSALQLLAS